MKSALTIPDDERAHVGLDISGVHVGPDMKGALTCSDMKVYT